MLFPSRASNLLLGSTYLTFLHLTTTNQVRSNFGIFVCLYFGSYCYFGTSDQMHVFVFGISTTQVRNFFCCWENWEFIGLALICSEVGHKNELSCRGVVVRTTSDPQLFCCCSVCGVCGVEFAWWPECSVNCQMINVQCAKCVFCAV